MRPGPEPVLGDGEARALLAEQVGGGHAAFFVADLAVAGALVVAHHRDRADQVEAGRVGRHADHRGARVGVGIGVGDDHRDRQVGADGARGEPLVAVDHPLVAVADRARLQQGRVRAGDGGLGHREAGADPPLEQRLEPAFALLVGAVLGEDLHVAGVGGRAVEGHRGGGWAAAHLLAEQAVLPVGQPGPEALVGHEQVPEPLRPRLLADLDQDLGVGNAARHLGVEPLHDLPLLRVDVVVHEVEDSLAQGGDLRARLEIHCGSSPRGGRAPQRYPRAAQTRR